MCKLKDSLVTHPTQCYSYCVKDLVDSAEWKDDA